MDAQVRADRPRCAGDGPNSTTIRGVRGVRFVYLPGYFFGHSDWGKFLALTRQAWLREILMQERTALGSAPDAETDVIERAMSVLRSQPYGPDASVEQENACNVLYRALLQRLLMICRNRGLDEQGFADVVHPKFQQLVTKDIARIGTTRADLEKWMSVVCRNGALTLAAARGRHETRVLEAAQRATVEAEFDEAWGEDEVEANEIAVIITEEPTWLDVRFPKGVDRDVFKTVIASLTAAEKRLFKIIYNHMKRSSGGTRLPATEIARELGTTPGTVSVRLSQLMKKIRLACGALANVPG